MQQGQALDGAGPCDVEGDGAQAVGGGGVGGLEVVEGRVRQHDGGGAVAAGTPVTERGEPHLRAHQGIHLPQPRRRGVLGAQGELRRQAVLAGLWVEGKDGGRHPRARKGEVRGGAYSTSAWCSSRLQRLAQSSI